MNKVYKLDKKLKKILEDFKRKEGNITILTGAGISAESGIPTFRGKEGYWTVGSKEYRPQDMATLSMFCLHPFEVWQWYLYRKTVVNRAKPNAGHHAVRALEEIFSDSFCLITQNVDGLHIRAGNSDKRTYQIHGNVNFMRCSNECTSEILPVPSKISEKDKNTPIKEEEKNLLICTYCGKMTRPHVLWFDESYNEKFYRFESSINRAQSTDLLIIVGTSGATTLPTYIVDIAVQKNAAVIDINPEENPFTNIVKSVENGYYIKGKSGDSLLRIVEFLKL